MTRITSDQVRANIAWVIRRRETTERELSAERVAKVTPLWKKTWVSAVVALISISGAVAIGIGGRVDLVATPSDVKFGFFAVCLVAFFAAAAVAENIGKHKWADRTIAAIEDEVDDYDRRHAHYVDELQHVLAQEEEERNLPAAVDALLVLLAAEAETGNPKVAAITGPKLGETKWDELADSHGWDLSTARQLRNANAAFHRARRA